jgi:mRNA interferase HigB
MVVLSYAKIKAFISKHPSATDPMNNWYRMAELADWSNYHEMKTWFGSVDAIGNDRYVFNVGGNNYRIIALIFFDIRTVYIRFVGRHSEYDELKNTTTI